MAQKPCVSRCHGMPCRTHRGCVVEHVALRALYGTEVGSQLLRSHNDLTQKQRAGTDDLADHADHADDSMYLGAVAAVGAKLFPDVWHRVHANNVDALVRQIQQIVCHGVEDSGVSVVQIPLVRVEGGHDDLPHVLEVSEIARRGNGEHLRDEFFVFVGNVPIIEEEIIIPVVLFSCPGALCPLMIDTGVVHHEVQTAADAPLMTVGGKLFQLLHGAELGLDLAEIGNGITSVAASLHRVQQRHEMDIVDAQLRQIVEFFPDAAQVSGKLLHIQAIAEQVVAPIPVWFGLAPAIQFFERGGT